MADENKARIEWAWRPGWTPEERRREVAALVQQCADRARSERPPVRIADLLAVPSAEELLAAGVRPVLVPVLGATLWRMSDMTRGAFLSTVADLGPDWLEAMQREPSVPRERLMLEALASALFGWLS